MRRIYNDLLKMLSLSGPGYRTRLGGMNARTLILVRWIAFAGQLAAVMIVEFYLQYSLPLYYCLVAIALLGISNLVIGMNYPRRGRLKNYHAARIMTFDLIQLSSLIYLTGGLHNPFSLLILVPVSVSATMLSRAAITMLVVLSVFAATFLAFYHLPLPWPGAGLDFSILYIAGLWMALVVAILFVAVYIWSLTEEARRTIDALSETEAALMQEQNLSALDGLAAAAAHELGSPLATIAVVAKELSREIPADSPLAEDAALLLSQSNRCRDILAGLARRPEDPDGLPLGKIPLNMLVFEAAENHVPAEIAFQLDVAEKTENDEPMLTRKPEILKGLGNIIQNAGQFAQKKILVSLYWDAQKVIIRIRDDGPGFSAQILDTLGDPYNSTQTGTGGHMGLGLFIAQNLLARVGAVLRYANWREAKGGAEVEIYWRRRDLERDLEKARMTGENDDIRQSTGKAG